MPANAGLVFKVYCSAYGLNQRLITTSPKPCPIALVVISGWKSFDSSHLECQRKYQLWYYDARTLG